MPSLELSLRGQMEDFTIAYFFKKVRAWSEEEPGSYSLDQARGLGALARLVLPFRLPLPHGSVNLAELQLNIREDGDVLQLHDDAVAASVRGHHLLDATNPTQELGCLLEGVISAEGITLGYLSCHSSTFRVLATPCRACTCWRLI